jgi:hypothetical protein
VVVIIHTVYVIHPSTGSCLVSENFSKDKITQDEDLISSYLVAIKSFAEEMSGGSGDLKVIDMDVYNLFLIVQKDAIVVGAADKSDDNMIIYHSLSELVSRFIKKYNSQSELDYWRGEILMFKDFRNDIKEVLREGKIGEVKKIIPLFKVYKKNFLKLIEQKDLNIKEAAYKKSLNIEGNKEWDTEKKLPKQPLSQGLLSEHQYKIAHLLNGFRTAEEIASEMKLPIEEVYVILKSIDDLGLLEYIELI